MKSKRWTRAIGLGCSLPVIFSALAVGYIGNVNLTWGEQPAKVESVSIGTPEESTIKEISGAWNYIRLEMQDQAQIEFKRILKQLDSKQVNGVDTPENLRLRTNIMYGQGLISSLSQHGSDRNNMRKLFNAIIQLQPKSEIAAWSALAMVRDNYLPVTATDPEDTKGLIDQYADIIKNYPGTAACDEAFVYQQGLILQLGVQDPKQTHPQEVVTAIEDFIKTHPKTRFLSALYYLKRYAYIELNDYPKALEADIKSVDTKEIDPTNPNQNYAFDYYRVGMEAQFDVGDFKTARYYYQKFLENYPSDQKAFNVKLMLKEMTQLENDIKAELKTPGHASTKGGQP